MEPEAPDCPAQVPAPIPVWSRWLMVTWMVCSLLALVWLDWDAAQRGVLCLPRN